MGDSREITGVLTTVQEDRFRLVDLSGRCHLFLLAHDAPLEADDLQSFLREDKPVRATIKSAHGLLAAVATAIDKEEDKNGSFAEAQ